MSDIVEDVKIRVGKIEDLTPEYQRGEAPIFDVTDVEVRRTALEMALEFHINEDQDATVTDIIKTASAFEEYIVAGKL